MLFGDVCLEQSAIYIESEMSFSDSDSEWFILLSGNKYFVFEKKF